MAHVTTPGLLCVSQPSHFLNFLPEPWGPGLSCGDPETCACQFASRLCHAVHGQLLALDQVLSTLSTFGDPRRALVVKPEAAGLSSGRCISEPSTPLAEATVRLSCRLGPWENFGRCQGGDVASRWEEWAGAGSGRAEGCTFPRP